MTFVYGGPGSGPPSQLNQLLKETVRKRQGAKEWAAGHQSSELPSSPSRSRVLTAMYRCQTESSGWVQTKPMTQMPGGIR